MKAAFLICLIIFLFTPRVDAAGQDNLQGFPIQESMLVPHFTREYHRQAMNLGERSAEVILYASSLSKKDIRKFYQNRLSNYGWQARDLDREVKDLSVNKPQGNGLASFSQSQMKSNTSGLDNLIKETLYWTKDNLMLSINFLPPRPNSNKTYFSLTLGQLKKDRQGLEAPFKSGGPLSISVYPGAAQVISSNSASNQTYGYLTKDSIDKAASFYKFDMPSRFNWSLVRESPITKSSYDFSKDNQACPACAKLPAEVRQAMGQTEASFIALKFKRGRETCLIGITQNESSARINPQAGQTRITIVWTQDEKTKP